MMASLWDESGEGGKIVSGTLGGTSINSCGPREEAQRTKKAGTPPPPVAPPVARGPGSGVFVPPSRNAQELPRASVDVCKRL